MLHVHKLWTTVKVLDSIYIQTEQQRWYNWLSVDFLIQRKERTRSFYWYEATTALKTVKKYQYIMLPMIGLSYNSVQICFLCSYPFVLNTQKTQRVQNICSCWFSITQRAVFTMFLSPVLTETGCIQSEIQTGKTASMEKSQHAEVQNKIKKFNSDRFISYLVIC